MICARHDWWDSAPCPKCDAPVTVAETPDEVENPELDIPEFLKRNPDGSFVLPPQPIYQHPGERRVYEPVPIPATLPIHHWSDLELYTALDNQELTLVERQPIYQELRAREDKKKSLARIAAMKAKKNEATKPPSD